VGLAVRQASQIEPSFILAIGYAAVWVQWLNNMCVHFATLVHATWAVWSACKVHAAVLSQHTHSPPALPTTHSLLNSLPHCMIVSRSRSQWNVFTRNIKVDQLDTQPQTLETLPMDTVVYFLSLWNVRCVIWNRLNLRCPANHFVCSSNCPSIGTLCHSHCNLYIVPQ
jgi:hypothetical protein